MSDLKYCFFFLISFFFNNCKINEVSYTSYPDDYATEAQAKEETARKALERLKDIYESKNKYETCLDSDIQLTTKIYDCLKSSPNGMLADYVPELFQLVFSNSFRGLKLKAY